MSEHYTKNTVSVTARCAKCTRTTVHRVMGGRLGPCTECLAKREAEAQVTKKPAAAEQLGLFSSERKAL